MDDESFLVEDLSNNLTSFHSEICMNEISWNINMITSVKAHKQLDTASQVYHLERDLAPYINQAKIHSTHFSYPNSLVVNKLK